MIKTITNDILSVKSIYPEDIFFSDVLENVNFILEKYDGHQCPYIRNDFLNEICENYDDYHIIVKDKIK